MGINKYIDLIIYLCVDWKSSSAATKGNLFGDAPFIIALSKIPGVRILCVNQPFTPVETIIKKREKAINWIKGNRLERLRDNLFLYTPLAFIHDMLAIYNPMLQWMNRAILSIQIRRQIKMLGFNSPTRVSWIYHPLQYPYFGLAEENFKVYKCWDLYKIRDYSNKLKRIMVSYEDIVLKDCDVVLTPCIKLYEYLRKVNKNTYFTPAGVDFSLFGKALYENFPIPNDMAVISTPRIGFSGNINEKVDMSLIRFLADSHKEWSIILLGNISNDKVFLENEDYNFCKKLSNVHFLGFKEFEVLPSYTKCLEVCMLSHSNIESMQYAHPYKTLQYLATGKPIVSTNFPDAHYYKDVISIAKDYKEFVTMIEKALNDTSEEAYKRRIDFAKKNTWDKRAEEIYDILNSFACRKK